jgi:hypothetical protein
MRKIRQYALYLKPCMETIDLMLAFSCATYKTIMTTMYVLKWDTSPLVKTGNPITRKNADWAENRLNADLFLQDHAAYSNTVQTHTILQCMLLPGTSWSMFCAISILRGPAFWVSFPMLDYGKFVYWFKHEKTSCLFEAADMSSSWSYPCSSVYSSMFILGY